MFLAIAILAAYLLPATAGAATPRIHPFATVHGGSASFATDGRRYVAYKPAADRLALRDDLSGRTADMAGAGDCEPRNGSHGVFLLACPRAPGYFVLRADGGSVTPVAGFGSSRETSSWDRYTSLGRIGAYWVEAQTSTGGGGGGVVSWYVNWHTGESDVYASTPAQVELAGPEAPHDPDSPSLRALGPEETQRLGEVYAEGAFFVRQVEDLSRPDPLVLFRRNRRFKTLDRCRTGCASFRLAAGRIVWQTGDSVVGYVLRGRHRVRWSVPPRSTVQHTAEHVFFLSGGSRAAPAPDTIRWARWPRG